ncbi:MAG TPA: hypothetical protein VEU11_13985, partial [Terriglobales bacterium]|nr:hypothetical protein [Terriglobales bacterium]
MVFLVFAVQVAPAPGAQMPGPAENPPRLNPPRASLHQRPLSFENSPRLRDLIRSGNLHLSLSDALALAIENNLDIELERFSFGAADADLVRAQGGGTLRGVEFVLSETPAGVGGPLSPLVTNPATSSTVSPGSTVATNAADLGLLGEAQTSLSVQGSLSAPQSSGTPVTIFDPALVGQLNWMHQTTPQTNSVVTGINSLVANTGAANVGIVEGFSTGTQINLAFNNSHQSLN